MLLSTTGFAQSNLIVTGVFDGPLTGGTPKAVEVYVVDDIADLSIYGFGSANNGGGSDGEEFTFPADAVVAGQYFYIATTTVEFNTFFGFDPDYVTDAAGINGDDAVEIFMNGTAVDVFGDINVDGTGEPWEYMDGWAYRMDGTGPSTTFTVSEWIYSGINALDGEATNASAATPWPLGTYSTEAVGATVVTITEIQETTEPSGDSPLLGELVQTTGIVTGFYEDGFWIQDGLGPWTGVFVRQDDPTVLRGDQVTVTGTVQENFGLTRLGNTSDLTINSSGNTLPDAAPVSTADAGTEPYEGVLIQITGATCMDNDLGFGEWLIDDGSGPYRADDEMFNANPQLFAGYDITGIAHYSFSNYKLLPRDGDDVSLNSGADVLGLSFTSSQLSFDETAGIVNITIDIYNPIATPVSVDLVVTGGNAVNGTHYNLTQPLTVTFPGGSADPQTFELEIIDDLDPNEDRTIELELQNPTDGALLAIDGLTVTIQDDDAEIIITDIGIVSEVDADGVAINLGQEYTVGGVVYGVNMNGNGLSFTMRDHTGGIGVYSSTVVDEYTVTEGDSILVTGTVDQYNGLTQLNPPTAITFISADNPLADPIVVTAFEEAYESNLIKLECVYLTEPGQWTGTGSGFNVTVSDGTNEFALRIDNDVDLYAMPAPAGTFDVVGILGQFDNSSPYLGGYQLFPRYQADIIPQECGITTPPVNDDCLAAISLDDLLGGDIGTAMNSTQYSNAGATVNSDDPSNGWDCFGEPDGSASAPSLEHTVWFKFTGDGYTYLIETNNCDGTAEDYIPEGDTQMAVYSGICGIFATPYACSEDGPNATEGNYAAGLEVETIAGQSYLIMIDGYNGAEGDFCISFTRQALANDECAGSADLSDLLGGAIGTLQTSGVYTNEGATSVDDPNPNDADPQCWFGTPLVEQTVWFTFEGDGNSYFIETLDCGVDNYIPFGDTQMAIFTGACDDLTQVACNEDGPQSTGNHYPAGLELLTVEGVTYYVMIDGYEGDSGEFCVGMTNHGPDGVFDAETFAFSAYPNPTQGMLTVESVETIDALTLLNVLGQKVKGWSFSAAQSVEVDTRDVPAGIYILRAGSNGKISTHKLVVE